MKRLLWLAAVLTLASAGCKCSGKATTPVAATPAPVKVSAAAPAVLAVGAPGTGQAPNLVGNGVSLALDAAGNPAVAFGSYDPNGDDDFSDSVISFSGFDEKTGGFKAPVTVDHPGDARKLGVHLAIDGAAIAIAYAKVDAKSGATQIWLASSTDGAAFSTVQVSAPEVSVSGFSSLAAAGGVLHLAWYDGDALLYRTGRAASLGAPVKVPVPEGLVVSSGGAPSVALDSEGAPAIAFGLALPQGGTLAFGYWRPAFEAAKIVVPTGAQNDDWAVCLAFAGTTPRVAMFASFAAVPGDGLKVTASSDDGTSWLPPAVVPNDGGQQPNLRVSMAVSAAGKSAISYGIGGGNLQGTTCAQPKVARAEAFSSWTVCSPTRDAFDIDYPSLAFTAGGKLVAAFQNVNPEAPPVGVLVYREP
jgi:hypothetical protein